MSSNISPNSHLQFRKVDVTISAIYPNAIVCTLGEEITEFFYSGQPVELKFADTNLPKIKGKLNFGDLGMNITPLVDIQDTSVYDGITQAFFLASFDADTSVDNEVVTAKDVRTSIKAEPARRYPFNNQQTVDHGKPGTISGEELLKVNTIKTVFTDSVLIPFVNSSGFIKLTEVNITPTVDWFIDNNFFEHKIKFSGVRYFDSEITIKFKLNSAYELVLFNDTFNLPYDIRSNSFSLTSRVTESIKLILQVKFQVANDNKFFLVFYVRFEGIGALQTSDTIKAHHYLNNISQLGYPEEIPVIGIEKFLTYQIKDIVNQQFLSDNTVNGNLAKDFIFQENTIGYNNHGKIITNEPGYSSLKPLEIQNNDDLNNFKAPGFYSYQFVTEDLNIPITNLPFVNTTEKKLLPIFRLEVFSGFKNKLAPLTGTYSPGYIYQTQILQAILLKQFELPDNAGTDYLRIHVEYTRTLSNEGVWSAWVEKGGSDHKHLADDIIESEEKQFVSQVDIDKWNTVAEITESQWKPSVDLIADLPASGNAIGDTRTVNFSGIIYQWFNNAWRAVSIQGLKIATESEDGLVSSTLFKKWDRTPLSIKVTELNNFVLATNAAIVYGTNYARLGDNTIDLISRTTNLTKNIGTNSIGIGYGNSGAFGYKSLVLGTDVNVEGFNSIAIGDNITTTNDYVIAIGISLLGDIANSVILGKFNKSLTSDGGIGFAIGDGISAEQRSNLFAVTKSGKTIVKGGYSIEGKTIDDIVLADGSTTSLQDLKDSLIQPPIDPSDFELTPEMIAKLPLIDTLEELESEEYKPNQPYKTSNGNLMYKVPTVFEDYTIKVTNNIPDEEDESEGFDYTFGDFTLD